MLSLWCLISALTQAGGGDLFFRSASSVQSCCGEGGALQADVAVCGGTRHVLARQPEVLAASPWVRCAFSLRGEQPGSQRAWRPLHGRGAPFPSAAPARSAGLASRSLHIGTGPVCSVGGGGFSL